MKKYMICNFTICICLKHTINASMCYNNPTIHISYLNEIIHHSNGEHLKGPHFYCSKGCKDVKFLKRVVLIIYTV